MPSWVFLWLVAPALLGNPSSRRNGPSVIPNPTRVTFGRAMVFSATVQSARPVREAELVLEDSFSRSFTYPARVTSQDGFLLSAQRDLQAEPVFPFSSIGYWWEILLDSGEKIVSERQSLQYVDDRFSWQSFARGRVTVGWVEGDLRAAQDAADLLLLNLGTISSELATPIPDGIRLYIYPRLADFHSGLGKLAYGWEGALSDPASGIILIAAASGAEGRRALATLLPHEAVHLLLSEKWKAAYAFLPLWLTEGTAAGYETEPRPEADRALMDAAKGGTLIPMATLCRSFPTNEKGTAEYAAGADCASGFVGSTGKSVDVLENSWRAWLNGRRGGMITTWTLVSGAFALLAGVLSAGWIIRRRRKPSPMERRSEQ
jgi:hypothetical protein